MAGHSNGSKVNRATLADDTTTPKTLRILAVDPGSRTSGFAVVDINGTAPKRIASGVIVLDAGERLSQRLCVLRDDLKHILNRYRPDEAVVESIFFSRNAQSALILGHARGIVLSVLEDYGLPIFEYSPAEIKQNISGSGRASKTSMAEMVKLLLKSPRSFEFKTSDESDALAIALAHAQIRRWKHYDRTSSRTINFKGAD